MRALGVFLVLSVGGCIMPLWRESHPTWTPDEFGPTPTKAARLEQVPNGQKLQIATSVNERGDLTVQAEIVPVCRDAHVGLHVITRRTWHRWLYLFFFHTDWKAEDTDRISPVKKTWTLPSEKERTAAEKKQATVPVADRLPHHKNPDHLKPCGSPEPAKSYNVEVRFVGQRVTGGVDWGWNLVTDASGKVHLPWIVEETAVMAYYCGQGGRLEVTIPQEYPVSGFVAPDAEKVGAWRRHENSVDDPFTGTWPPEPVVLQLRPVSDVSKLRPKQRAWVEEHCAPDLRAEREQRERDQADRERRRQVCEGERLKANTSECQMSCAATSTSHCGTLFQQCLQTMTGADRDLCLPSFDSCTREKGDRGDFDSCVATCIKGKGASGC